MAYTAINDPEAYFQVQLYTGNGSANHAITLGGDTNMQPDLVWIKNRDTTDAHCLFDAVRGATKVLHVTTAAESTDADTLDSFTSDGFQVDADVKVNTNAEKYVAWCWKESATSGVDVITYTGSGSAETIAHSLSAAPTFLIIKSKDGVRAWAVGHASITFAKFLELNVATTVLTATNRFNDTAPTSSVFSIGADSGTTNTADSPSENYIAYCFADVQGFSKFGSYVGHGNADGSFVFLGFRPAFVMIKGTGGTTNWHMYDDQRLGYNIDNNSQRANLETADQTDDDIDLFSNGFKIKRNTSALNTSGGTYVYAAFAKAPFVNSNGVPCNAK